MFWTGDPAVDARRLIEGSEADGDSPLRRLVVIRLDVPGTSAVVRGIPIETARELLQCEEEHGTEAAIELAAAGLQSGRIRRVGYPVAEEVPEDDPEYRESFAAGVQDGSSQGFLDMMDGRPFSESPRAYVMTTAFRRPRVGSQWYYAHGYMHGYLKGCNEAHDAVGGDHPEASDSSSRA